MPYPGTPEFSQMLLEAQMTMWEAVALILALSIIVLFIIILGSIAWLCLSELSRARRGRLILLMMENLLPAAQPRKTAVSRR